MKQLLIAAVAAMFIFCFCYSASAFHELIVESTRVVEPGADAVELYAYIMKPEPYYNLWNLSVGTKKLAAGRAPHGSFITTYVNDTALSSLRKKENMGNGSIIVMQNYNAQEKLETLSVMYKIKDYNPGAGDWFWVEYDANNGHVLASGMLDACITCHRSKQNDDYLYKE